MFRDEAEAEAWRDPERPGLAPKATGIRVWRRAGGVFHAPMDALERPAFLELAAGGTFADVCDALPAAAAAGAPREAGALLARWRNNFV